MSSSSNGASGRNGAGPSRSSSNGPCGACKFLRRKCVRGCVFAPYFDAEQGPAHFAAVHKVFGASNASKLLSRIPSHMRLDAVVCLCYEALARVSDPVYGSVGHIISLQQQVVNLQSELSYIQAGLSTLHRLPLPSSSSSLPQPAPVHPCTHSSVQPTSLPYSSEMVTSSRLNNMSFSLDQQRQTREQQNNQIVFCSNSSPFECEGIVFNSNGDLNQQALTLEIMSGIKPPS